MFMKGVDNFVGKTNETINAKNGASRVSLGKNLEAE